MATQQLTHAYSLKKDDEASSLETCKSQPSTAHPNENTRTGGLDCNICLDSVQDPVITFCGHLYCWPCIYKWIHYQTSSSDQNQEKHLQPQCPICKSQVSQQALIPLYGRGQETEPAPRSDPQLGLVIPKRPTTPRCGVRANATRRPSDQPRQQYVRQEVYLPANSTTGMFGEMVYSTVFGSNREIGSYSYPNGNSGGVNYSPRVRRQVKEAERSLSRLCFFLCCCVVLCLFLF
jgi:E3 ubiquitin-protein ligase RNF5